MNNLTHLSLFTGIGGLDLAAEWAGIETIGQCEYADYPTKVLEKHWPDVPRWRDIRTLTGDSFYGQTGRRTVDIISGGFPCQPFSTAGKRRGKEDDRYLWPEMVRVIAQLRPAWVIGENVAGIINMALDTVLSDLESQGYATRTFLLPACTVGARHRRYRVAVVAYAQSQRLQKIGKEGEQVRRTRPAKREFERGGDVRNPTSKGLPDRPGESMAGQRASEPEPKRPDRDVSDADCRKTMRREPCEEGSGKNGGGRADYVGRNEKYESRTGRTAQPGMGGMADGLSFWLDRYWDIEPDTPRIAAGIKSRAARLKALGNAVVPQQFYPFFKAIADIERG